MEFAYDVSQDTSTAVSGIMSAAVTVAVVESEKCDGWFLVAVATPNSTLWNPSTKFGVDDARANAATVTNRILFLDVIVDVDVVIVIAATERVRGNCCFLGRRISPQFELVVLSTHIIIMMCR